MIEIIFVWPNIYESATLISMLKQTLLCASFALILSCKTQVSRNNVQREMELHIMCENEKYLIEDSIGNLPYSFDTIFSTKSYWKHVRHDVANSIGKRLFPYTLVTTDSPSLYPNVKVNLVGYGDFKNDSRLKIMVSEDRIDSSRIANFYEEVLSKPNGAVTHDKAALFLSFYKDSTINISKSLKKIAQIYISVQEKNSIRLFNTKLCSLDKDQIDLIRKSIPFRIHLIRSG